MLKPNLVSICEEPRSNVHAKKTADKIDSIASLYSRLCVQIKLQQLLYNTAGITWYECTYNFAIIRLLSSSIAWLLQNLACVTHIIVCI